MYYLKKEQNLFEFAIKYKVYWIVKLENVAFVLY